MNDNIVCYKDLNVIISINKKEKIIINDNSIELSILDIIIEKDNIKTYLGNFYIVLDNKLNNKNLKIIVKELIDNIDYIMFEKTRFIGVLKKNKILNDESILDLISMKHIREYDIELKNIYLEFFDLDKSTKEYREYSYFLEMEFISHGIPDTIKNIFLKNKRKSILDYTTDELNNEIRSNFINDYSEYINPYLYEENTKKLNKLKVKIKNLLDQLENMEEVINNIEDVSNKIEENSKIIMQMDIIKSEISNLSIFNYKRIKLNKDLKELEKGLHSINESDEIEKVGSTLTNKDLIKSLNSILAIKDKIKKEYKIKSKEYNELIKEYNAIYESIEDYENNKIDISNLRERLDSI